MTRTVLITGAAGRIGRKVAAHLEARGGYALRRLDVRADGPDVVAADLAEWDEGWAAAFDGVDTVLHLAAHPSPEIDWATAQRLNLDLTFNVLHAAGKHRVRRVVFASSNWVMAGYRDQAGPLKPDMAPLPVNPYGVSKLVGERAGRSLADRGISFIGLRIGYSVSGEGRPATELKMGLWGRQMWLSDRDLCQGFERSILADGIDFAVVNLMSDNPGMRWSLDETRRVLGYEPVDGYPAGG